MINHVNEDSPQKQNGDKQGLNKDARRFCSDTYNRRQSRQTSKHKNTVIYFNTTLNLYNEIEENVSLTFMPVYDESQQTDVTEKR